MQVRCAKLVFMHAMRGLLLSLFHWFVRSCVLHHGCEPCRSWSSKQTAAPTVTLRTWRCSWLR
jgi:hypothetical protein